MDVTFTTDIPNTLHALLSGEIDHHSAKKMRETIDAEILANPAPFTLILDFSEVTFMDSSGIGLVMGRFKKMNELDGSIIIHNPANHIKKVMRLSGIDRIAKIT